MDPAVARGGRRPEAHHRRPQRPRPGAVAGRRLDLRLARPAVTATAVRGRGRRRRRPPGARPQTWAVVGLRDNPARAAYRVARFLQDKGRRIVPVHPMAQDVHGETGLRHAGRHPLPGRRRRRLRQLLARRRHRRSGRRGRRARRMVPARRQGRRRGGAGPGRRARHGAGPLPGDRVADLGALERGTDGGGRCEESAGRRRAAPLASVGAGRRRRRPGAAPPPSRPAPSRTLRRDRHLGLGVRRRRGLGPPVAARPADARARRTHALPADRQHHDTGPHRPLPAGPAGRASCTPRTPAG